MRRRLIALIVTSLAACQNLEHESPYDPLTPSGEQARTSFAGTVTLEPVAGVVPGLAGIQVSVAGHGYAATTDANGGYLITGVPAGTYTVQAVVADYETTSVTGVTATLDTGGGTVTVPPISMRRVRGDLAGTVDLQLPNGSLESTGGANVSLSAPAGGGGGGGAMFLQAAALGPAAVGGGVSGAALTDGSGAFVIPDVPAPIGSYTLTASKVGYVTQTTTVTFENGAFVVQTVQLQIDPGAIVGSVRVAGGSGNPLDVIVRARGTTLGGTTWEDVTTPDDLGAFRLSGLPAGTYTVSYEGADLVTASVPGCVVDPGGETPLDLVDVQLATGSISGAFPLTSAASSGGVVVTASSGSGGASTVTDSAGAFTLTGVPVGSYTVTARKDPDWQPATTPGVTVSRGQTTPLGTTALQPWATASLGGKALLERASDHTGTTVTLSGTDFRGVAVPAGTTTTTGSDGSWLFPGLRAGSYQVTFVHAAFDTPAPVGLAVITGQAASIGTVTLPVSTGTIAGQVVLSRGTASAFVQGTDYSGTIVTLSGLQSGVEVPAAVTDASGNFRFDRVPVHTAHLPYGVLAQHSSYSSRTGSVTAEPGATVPVQPNPITLPVDVGSVSGTVAVNDTGSQATPANGAVTVTLTGTAFNSTSFSANASNAGASFSIPNLPAGTYEVLATSTGRACPAPSAVTVQPGQAVVLASTIVCTDAVAPGNVALGTPQGPGAEPGFTSSTAISVPIATHASDQTGNIRGYQYAAGGVPAWAGAPVTAGLVSSIPFPVNTLTSDGTWTLWVRAVDLAGNAGSPSSVQVVRDTQRPAAVAISTARTVVDATSTTAIITGGADSNFRTYQSCTSFAAPTAACPSPCTPVDTAPSIAITFDAPNRKACVWARALDRAGNGSASLTSLELVSDLIPPSGPTFAPLYDPATVTVHADYVDFRITGAATDQPGPGADWQDIAWVEADTGGGFTPICPDAACRASGSYDPCSCGCTDPRLVCNGSAFWAIRMPLNSGTANSFSVRSVDVAGNVGSGASQQVLTSGVLSAVETSRDDHRSSRVRGRTLAYASYGNLTVVDLGANLRWDASDATCTFYGVSGYEFAFVPLDSSTIVYSTGSEVRVRRKGATWCSGFSEATIGTRSSSAWTIHPVAATFDPATGRLERVAWAENDTTNHATRLWTRDPGTGGKIDAGDAPAAVMVHEKAGTMTSRVVLGGDVLVVRSTTASYVQSIDGAYTVLHRPVGGWGSATPAVFSLEAYPAAIAASVDSTGSQLAWVANDPTQTLHVAKPGADGVFGTSDDATLRWTKTWSTASTWYADVAVEGGHVVVTDMSPSPTGYLTHWAAGADGTFGSADDAFARILPTSAGRTLPSLGDGLGGGVVFFTQSGGNNYDVFTADLSAVRWDTLSDASSGVYPRSNRAGTYFFGRPGGVWARAPDGRETTLGVDSHFYAADGNVFAGHVGRNVVLHQADSNGYFFTDPANAVTVLTNKAGYGFYGGSIDIQAGAGRFIVGTCEAANAGGTCTEHSVTLLEPNPTPATPRVIRLDRPQDGAPPNTYVLGYNDGMGVSARHAVHRCSDSGAGIGGAICVREPGPNGRYDVAGTLGYDDVTFLLRIPGPGPTWTPYSGTSAVRLDGDRVAFFQGGDVVSVDAGPDRRFNTSDDVATVVGTSTESQGQFLAIAGNYVAWMSSGTTGGPEPWVADARNGTSRQVASHYSSKYGITVERTGRVVWEDHIFSTLSVFVSAP